MTRVALATEWHTGALGGDEGQRRPWSPGLVRTRSRAHEAPPPGPCIGAGPLQRVRDQPGEVERGPIAARRQPTWRPDAVPIMAGN